jgi:membrane protein implicated in regulation of membrane protease activity
VLFLVVALVLLAFVLGSVAYLPLPVTLVVSAVIAVWLAVFAVRERRRRTRTEGAGT